MSAEVAQIADYINEHIRSYDNTQRILEIQRRLTGGDKRLNVIEPGRLFIKEGLLKKVYHPVFLRLIALRVFT